MKKTGKAYRRLFISYIVIFLIPIIMGVSFYFFVYHAVSEQTDTTNTSLISIVKQECDREIRVYENVLTQLALNQNIQELSLMKDRFGDDDAYSLYTLQNELLSVETSGNQYGKYYKDIFVYFNSSDKVVSSYGNMSLEMYYELYYPGCALSYDEFRDYLTGPRYLDVKYMERLDEKPPYLMMTMTNLRGNFKEPGAVVGILMDTEGLSATIESAAWEKGVIPLIINSENQILNRWDPAASDLNLIYSELEAGDNRVIVWNGRTYLSQVRNADNADWKYVLMMPEAIISGQVGRIRSFFIIGILICIAAGSWASIQMLKINYDPLKSLMEIFQKSRKNEEEGFEGSEYEYLREKASSLLQEHEDYRNMIIKDREVVRRYYLTRLLEAPYYVTSDDKIKDSVPAKMADGHNLVLTFLVSGKPELEEQCGSEETNSLRRFIISNVFTEGIGEYFTRETVELGDTIAMIVNIPEMKDDFDKLLRAQADILQKFIAENFAFQVTVAAGEPHMGLAGIHESYREAREAEEFISILEPDYIAYGEIRTTDSRQYEYPAQMEEKIIAGIHSGNAQLAVSYVNRVLEQNCKENRIPPYMFRCLIYDLLGTVIKGAGQSGEEQRAEEDGLYRDFPVKRPLDEIKAAFNVLISRICAERSRLPETASEADNGLSKEILQFIMENYQNPDLNISQTGLRFHMTPAYLSAIYKKQTGESLLKVINRIRMDEAQKLLAEGASVVEAAEKAGFRDPSTFIRAFKKATGITPGQIKGK